MAESSFPHLARPGDLPTSGGTGAGGDSPHGEPDKTLSKDRDPAARSTTPDAAATNHDHPTSPGVRTAVPGEGLSEGVGTPVGTTPAANDAGGTPAAQAGLIAGGINRVEDQSYTSNPRLNPATDEAGPGPSLGTPELQDPNYTAKSEK